MTLRYSSSDSYANSHDNLSYLPRIHRWTTTHLIASNQNPKTNSSADNSPLRLKIAPTLTAFIKTTYNRVARQLRSWFIVAQAQTAVQIICKTTLANINAASQTQKSHSPFLFLNYCKWHICICSIARIKTRIKKFMNFNLLFLFHQLYIYKQLKPKNHVNNLNSSSSNSSRCCSNEI